MGIVFSASAQLDKGTSITTLIYVMSNCSAAARTKRLYKAEKHK